MQLRHAAEQNDVEGIYRVLERFPIAFRPPQNSAAAALSSSRIPAGRTRA